MSSYSDVVHGISPPALRFAKERYRLCTESPASRGGGNDPGKRDFVSPRDLPLVTALDNLLTFLHRVAAPAQLCAYTRKTRSCSTELTFRKRTSDLWPSSIGRVGPIFFQGSARYTPHGRLPPFSQLELFPTTYFAF